MSRICDNCQKTSIKAVKRKKTRSKYNPVNVYRQRVNLRFAWVKLKAQLPRQRMRLCMKCYKKLSLETGIKN